MNSLLTLGSAKLLPAYLLCVLSLGSRVFGQDLRVSGLSPGPTGTEVRWDSTPGAATTIQMQESLSDGLWRIPAALFPFPSSQGSWLDPHPAESNRFYRAVSVEAAQRGKLIEVVPRGTFTIDELAYIFSLGNVPITPRFPVTMFKLRYETITPLGARTVASGALCLPVQTEGALPLVSYQHGTIIETNAAPSAFNVLSEVAIALALASDGYAAVEADYLGLGDSPGLHPYHLARSEATACVDMLRAAKGFCISNDYALSGKLFLCGYSQGGHATMALLRELEWFHTNEFSVTACAPMAGAYDLSGTTASDLLSTRPQPNPYYFLYFLAAYLDVYHPGDRLADYLAGSYRTNLPPLLDGNHSGDEINRAMPTVPAEALRPEVLAELRANPRQWLRLALEDNDIYRWKPVAPLRFYHCAGDHDVLKLNSLVAVSYLNSIGRTDITLEDPSPNSSHRDCAEPSLLAAKAWFDSLR